MAAMDLSYYNKLLHLIGKEKPGNYQILIFRVHLLMNFIMQLIYQENFPVTITNHQCGVIESIRDVYRMYFLYIEQKI